MHTPQGPEPSSSASNPSASTPAGTMPSEAPPTARDLITGLLGRVRHLESLAGILWLDYPPGHIPAPVDGLPAHVTPVTMPHLAPAFQPPVFEFYPAPVQEPANWETADSAPPPPPSAAPAWMAPFPGMESSPSSVRTSDRRARRRRRDERERLAREEAPGSSSSVANLASLVHLPPQTYP